MALLKIITKHMFYSQFRNLHLIKNRKRPEREPSKQTPKLFSCGFNRAFNKIILLAFKKINKHPFQDIDFPSVKFV